MLREIYSDKKSIPTWELEWGVKIFCNHGTKHSKGVMILVNPKYDAEIVSVEEDNNGRLIIRDIKINDTHEKMLQAKLNNLIAQAEYFRNNSQLRVDMLRC